MISNKIIGLIFVILGVGFSIVFIGLLVYDILPFEIIMGLIIISVLTIVGFSLKYILPVKQPYHTKEEQMVKSGDYDKAIEYYSNKLKNNKKNKRILGNLSSIYIIKGEYDLAIDICKNLLDLDPNNNEALYNLSKAYYHIRQFNDAIKTVEKLLENISIDFPKKDFDIWIDLAKIYYEKGELKNAIKWIDKSLEKRPLFKKALNIREEIQTKIIN